MMNKGEFMSLFSNKRMRNFKKSMKDQLMLRISPLAMPTTIHFEVNDICNLNCVMCARKSPDVPKDTGNLDPEIVRKTEPELQIVKYAGLAGNGEPFLHPHLFDILEILCSSGCVPSIVTNGTLLTEDRRERLTRTGASILNISFDGATPETFEFIRNGARFRDVLGNLRKLKARKESRKTPFPIFNFLVCVMKQNSGELEDIVDIAAELGVMKIEFQTVYPFTNLARESMITELSQIEKVIGPAVVKARNLGIQAGMSPLSFGIDARLEHRGEKRTPSTPLFCENIWKILHVGVNGDVRFCCFWTGESIGNLAERSIRELWTAPSFVELRRMHKEGKIPPDCRNCHILDIHRPEIIEKKSGEEIQNYK